MPRYFFHKQDRTDVVDDDGLELPGKSAAKVEAARLLGGLITHTPQEVWDHGGLKVAVTDEAGAMVFAMTVATVEAPEDAPIALILSD